MIFDPDLAADISFWSGVATMPLSFIYFALRGGWDALAESAAGRALHEYARWALAALAAVLVAAGGGMVVKGRPRRESMRRSAWRIEP